VVALLLGGREGPRAVLAVAQDVWGAPPPLGRLRQGGLRGRGAQVEGGVGLQTAPYDRVLHAELLVSVEGAPVDAQTLAAPATEPYLVAFPMPVPRLHGVSPQPLLEVIVVDLALLDLHLSLILHLLHVHYAIIYIIIFFERLFIILITHSFSLARYVLVYIRISSFNL